MIKLGHHYIVEDLETPWIMTMQLQRYSMFYFILICSAKCMTM